MASSKDFLTYVLDLLRDVKGISSKKMMGEYILYKEEVIFGGIYDNRFLIKKSESNKQYHFKEAIPYPGGKSMFIVDVEDSKTIKDLVENTYKDLKSK